jgi:hypothetical protein
MRLRRSRRRLRAVLVAVALASAGLVTASPAADAATSYYVAVDGDDAAPGTASRPFRTIQRCALVAQRGDTCNVTSGVYRETVRPARSGTASEPITYRAAPGALVAVTGADQLGGWRPVTPVDLSALVARDPTLASSEFAGGVGSGEVYAADVTLPAPTGQQLFYDGAMMVEGQWPHAGPDLLNPTLRIAGTGTTNTRIADAGLTKPAGYWDGARVYASHWFVPQSGRVANYRPGSFDITDSPGSCVGLQADNTRYYLYGKLQAMTRRGTWFYDHSAGRVYLWTPDGGSPAGHNVEIKRRDLAFDLTAASHTVVTGLTFFGNTIRTGDTSTGVVIDGVHGRYLSHYTEVAADPPLTPGACNALTSGESTTGVVLRGTGNTIRNSILLYSAGNGVAVLGSGNTVTGNEIRDVDYLGSYAAGVDVGGPNRVSHNTISRTGRSGINIGWHLVGSRLNGAEIDHNDVSGYDRLSVDSAAIYVCCEIDMAGSSIHHNWVHDAQTMPGVRPWAAAGIYLDNSVRNALVHNNVGWNNPDTTVFVHGNNASSTGNRVLNNTGGAWLLNIADGTGTRVMNTIGELRVQNATGVTYATNFAGDPLFVNPAARDYTLRPESPARNAGTFITWITVGHTDPNPSIGAYQYGAPRWTAGR